MEIRSCSVWRRLDTAHKLFKNKNKKPLIAKRSQNQEGKSKCGKKNRILVKWKKKNSLSDLQEVKFLFKNVFWGENGRRNKNKKTANIFFVFLQLNSTEYQGGPAERLSVMVSIAFLFLSFFIYSIILFSWSISAITWITKLITQLPPFKVLKFDLEMKKKKIANIFHALTSGIFHLILLRPCRAD